MGRDSREWLLVKEPRGSEARVDIGSSPVRIGRGRENQVVLRDDYVSAAHAELVQHRGERCVRDLGSRNGTRVNGRTLERGTLHALRSGDVLEIGRCNLTYHCFPSSDGATVRPLSPPDEEDTTRRAPTDREPRPSSTVLPTPPLADRRRGWRRIGPAVLLRLLVGVAVMGAVAGVLWALAPPRVMVLVLGGDARPDELRRGHQGRTDTVLAVVADRRPAGLALISVPRDLWVDIPGFGGERINAAYSFGGPPAAKRVASDVLGVRLDRYLLIGLQGVRDVVDAAGGVEIDVPRPIHDDAYPTDDYRTIVVDIPAGRQRMDGETALRYARTRHQDNDFGRIARQQQLVVGLRNALLHPRSWWRLPAVIYAVRQATQTDLGPLELVTLGAALAGSPGEPDRLAVDLTMVEEFTGPHGEALLRPRPALRQRVAALLTPSSAVAEVLNATPTEGLAKQTADRLASGGMRVARFGNAARPQPETTVEVRPGLRRAGVYAATILDLPTGAVRESPDLLEGVDVRITLGEDRTRL